MTEPEAMAKTCPLAPLAPMANTWIGGCIGSECMAWRWSKGGSPQDVLRSAERYPQEHATRPFVACGYCGLAGPLED